MQVTFTKHIFVGVSFSFFFFLNEKCLNMLIVQYSKTALSCPSTNPDLDIWTDFTDTGTLHKK